MRSLTPKQRRFVTAYVADLNATRAAIRAGYSRKTARWIGPRLVTKSHVRAEIDALQSRVTDSLELSAANTLEELRRILHFNPGQLYDANGELLPMHELPPEVCSCIASYETREIFAGKGENRRMVARVVKLRFWSKTKAIAMAMAYLNLLPAGRLRPAVTTPEQEARAAELRVNLFALLTDKEALAQGRAGSAALSKPSFQDAV